MNIKELNKMAKVLVDEARIMSTPIDFDQPIKDGLIRKINNSFYTDNVHNLPENVGKKLKSVTPTKYGFKMTFYRETKSLKKLAEEVKYF